MGRQFQTPFAKMISIRFRDVLISDLPTYFSPFFPLLFYRRRNIYIYMHQVEQLSNRHGYDLVATLRCPTIDAPIYLRTLDINFKALATKRNFEGTQTLGGVESREGTRKWLKKINGGKNLGLGRPWSWTRKQAYREYTTELLRMGMGGRMGRYTERRGCEERGGVQW